MRNPLSPVVANIYMEYFEALAIESARLKPANWLRYVDDTFVVWKEGKDKLQDFLEHLNTIRPSIQFTMEVEEDVKIPFLDVLVTRGADRLTAKVYRKATHTDRYIHSEKFITDAMMPRTRQEAPPADGTVTEASNPRRKTLCILPYCM